VFGKLERTVLTRRGLRLDDKNPAEKLVVRRSLMAASVGR
jgi:hypothetical protein